MGYWGRCAAENNKASNPRKDTEEVRGSAVSPTLNLFIRNIEAMAPHTLTELINV